MHPHYIFHFSCFTFQCIDLNKNVDHEVSENFSSQIAMVWEIDHEKLIIHIEYQINFQARTYDEPTHPKHIIICKVVFNIDSNKQDFDSLISCKSYFNQHTVPISIGNANCYFCNFKWQMLYWRSSISDYLRERNNRWFICPIGFKKLLCSKNNSVGNLNMAPSSFCSSWGLFICSFASLVFLLFFKLDAQSSLQNTQCIVCLIFTRENMTIWGLQICNSQSLFTLILSG